MKILGLVFLGGGLGSMVRFAIGKWVAACHQLAFPLSTLLANVAACFVMGLIIGFADHKQTMSPNTKLFWAVGFCGGFSTFSAFTHETLILIQNGQGPSGLLYVMLSLALCSGATLAGLFLAGLL